MKMETPRSLRLIAKPSDRWVSFDLKDGFYSLAIVPQDKEAFNVHLDGNLLQFARYRWAEASARSFSKSSRRCSRTTSEIRSHQPLLRQANKI